MNIEEANIRAAIQKLENLSTVPTTHNYIKLIEQTKVVLSLCWDMVDTLNKQGLK